MTHFQINNLSFKYPDTEKYALKNINLHIDKGEYLAICGKSGGGKSTLLRQLKTTLTPHGMREGEIYFDGEELAKIDLKKQSSSIGYVLQNPDSQIVTDKVWHELAFGLESLGYDQKVIRLRVAEMASYFGIQNWFHKNVDELSGGQKQLLNLASIMAMQPEVLILDEPTSQLDPIAAADFLNTVKKINLELGTTIIITEHRLEDVFHCADRVVVIDDSEIIACDTPKKVGKILKDSQNDMFVGVPAPMQIYFKADSGENSPLTVREGRNWLDKYFSQKEISHTKIKEEDELDFVEGKDCAVYLKEVWFRYSKEGNDILKGLSLKVQKNKIFSVVGGNGTGKSTMLKAICGINKIYRGKIYIDGKAINKYHPTKLFKENLAMLPQEPQSLFVKKTVREDLKEVIEKNKFTEKEINKKVEFIAKLCEVHTLLNSHPYDLSGGEQQRAALAKLMLTNPKILLLDEPTKGIDNFFKIKLGEILRKLTDSGVTIIMVSHDVEFCAKYSDAVSMFFDGDILTTNTPNRFFASNNFYTTAANRMSRHIFKNAVRNEDVISLCKINS